jgi:hypothetical protein
MSEQDAGGVQWDAPNQQVVRSDASPPWQEGTGGEEGPVAEVTKDELLARAQALGVVPANAGMTKDELQAGIDAKLAEEEAPA